VLFAERRPPLISAKNRSIGKTPIWMDFGFWWVGKMQEKVGALKVFKECKALMMTSVNKLIRHGEYIFACNTNTPPKNSRIMKHPKARALRGTSPSKTI
jgi:hypothetical protein